MPQATTLQAPAQRNYIVKEANPDAIFIALHTKPYIFERTEYKGMQIIVFMCTLG